MAKILQRKYQAARFRLFCGDAMIEVVSSRPARYSNQQTINTRKPQHPRAFPGKGRERDCNFYPGIFAASTSTFSIDGGLDSNSDAFAISAAAIGPLR